MVGLVGFVPAFIRSRCCERRKLWRGAGGRVRAELRERILRPAALARRMRRRRGSFGFLLAKFARRQSETMPKRPAEMCGIAKAIAIGDFRDRPVRLGGTGQIGPRPLQPAFANVMGEIVADPLKQLLQIALGDAFGLGDARRREVRIVEPALDGLTDPVQDRRLRRGVAGVRRRACELVRECQQ